MSDSIVVRVRVRDTELELRTDRVYHIALASEWGPHYRPPSLETDPSGAEGFVHLSTAAELAETVSRHFPNDTSDVSLVIAEFDPTSFGAQLRYESVPGRSNPMPHLYGELDLRAVVRTHSIE